MFRTTLFPAQIHVLKSYLVVKCNLKNTQIQGTYHVIINVATGWVRKWCDKKWGTTHSRIVLSGVQFIPKLSWGAHNTKYLSGRQVRLQCNKYKSDKQDDNFGGESNSNDGYKNRSFNRKSNQCYTTILSVPNEVLSCPSVGARMMSFRGFLEYYF